MVNLEMVLAFCDSLPQDAREGIPFEVSPSCLTVIDQPKLNFQPILRLTDDSCD